MYRDHELDICVTEINEIVFDRDYGADNEVRDHDLPAIAYLLLAGCFGALMLLAFLVFWKEAEALFMVVISAFYLVMYMGIPYVMYGMKKDIIDDRREPLFIAMKQRVGTLTGPISGFEAMTQVLTVPVALLLAFASMGIILLFGV